MSAVLASGKTPEEWADVMNDRGIPISVRTLREAANRLGACHKIGRAMIITPDQLDMILTEKKACPSKPSSVATTGGRVGASNTTGGQSPTTSVAALAHLQKLAHGNGAGKKKTGKSAVISLVNRRA